MNQSILNQIKFSYSTYDLYKRSPLEFYFSKIAKAEPSDPGMPVYGDAGNVVHNAIEDYWNNNGITFDKHWKDYNIDNQRGFKGSKLSYNNYQKMLFKALEHIKNFKYDLSKAELRIDRIFFDINFIAFIDLYLEYKGEITLIDWKTNSTFTKETHKLQRLFYSWLVWQIKKVIPTCKWYYLKTNKIVEEKFTEKELQTFFQEHIIQFKNDLIIKGTVINNYELGEWTNPFNQYYSLCKREMEIRSNKKEQVVRLDIKGNFVFISGIADQTLYDGIDFKTSFDLPNKFWMQKHARQNNRGLINYNDIGTYHLFNMKYKCFPIGLMDKVIQIIRDYESFYNKKIQLVIKDYRDIKVMDYKTKQEYKDNNIVLRPYQNNAVEKFLLHETGIIHIATGGGKTIIAAEIIKKVNTRTLWIIDRKELLIQTKNELEKYLGTPVGVLFGGQANFEEITVATVQSLYSRLDNIKEYLYNINFVVVDEFHKSAASTYQKVFAKLPNTRYRLGLTATPKRDDGLDPVLFSILGNVLYKVSTENLIQKGYLVKPNIIFYDMKGQNLEAEDYPFDYKYNIVENHKRNEKIIDVCKENKDKKILIVTKLVNHAKTLLNTIEGSIFIHGSLDTETREKYMQQFRNGEKNILIITISIGAEGLDIPDLDIMINAAANKGEVKSIQVLGRVLRMFQNKEKAKYIDFVDYGTFTRKHSKNRIKTFKSENHEVIIK